MSDGDPIASGGSEPVTSSPDLITAIAAVTDASTLATAEADEARAASASAAASLFQIKQSWYGSLAGNPALDPNNNGPANGALYFNTTMDRLMTYEDGTWRAVVGIFLTGAGAPGVGDGADGDFYVQMPAGMLYGPKAGGTWPAGIAIAGVGPSPWTTPAAWAASTVYTVGPPASFVVYNDEGYVCTTSHTSTGSFDGTKWIKVTSSATIPSTSITDSTAAGRAILTAANAAAQRTALGLGTAALVDESAVGNDLMVAANAAAARATLGLGTLATGSTVAISQAPSGSFVLLATLTASNSASLSDTTNFTATYDEYEIVFESVIPGTVNTDLRMQIRTGTTFQTADYKTLTTGSFGGAFASVIPTGHLALSNDYSRFSATSNGLSGSIRINFVNGAGYKKIWGQTVWPDTAQSDGLTISWVTGMWVGGTGAITGVRFLMSSGNISSGKIYIYGRKK